MKKLNPNLSLPGERAIGPTSPVQQALALIEKFFSQEPTPDIGTPSSLSSSLLVGNHLLQLIHACGLLNGSGFHSSSIILLRPLEDALDCFAAVILIKGAAEQWGNRKLKPSDAAKIWTKNINDILTDSESSLSDYRKKLRGQFNHYTHCSYDLCLWDLYFNPKKKDPETGQLYGPLEINHHRQVINSNGHAIDAHLTAHILEFIDLIKRAYSHALSQNSELSKKLNILEKSIIKIMKLHNKHKCQNVFEPPEIRMTKS